MGILSTLWDVTIGQLTSPSNAGPRPVTNDDLVPIVQRLGYESNLLDDVLAEADGLAATSVPVATDAGAAIARIGDDLKFITEHTYKVVLPHSMAWLHGAIVSKHITKLLADLTKLEKEVAALIKWRASEHSWRVKHVDPELAQYEKFQAAFNGWPTQVLTAVHGWFTTPQQFATFAVPVIVAPIVNYLSIGANRPTLDNLTLLILQASPDRYRYAVAAFEAMLDQDWP